MYRQNKNSDRYKQENGAVEARKRFLETEKSMKFCDKQLRKIQ